MKNALFFLLLTFSTFSLLGQKIEEAPNYYIFSIYFGGGSYYIDGEQTKSLHEWLDGIDQIDNMDISIHSHTDNIGSKAYNDWLSQMRSESAIYKLVEKGLREEMMSIEDFGEFNPVYDNSTWEGKLKNRRVDIILRPIVF
ncbi:MAG: OmpA family protein [Saprospiraceae bacterium]